MTNTNAAVMLDAKSRFLLRSFLSSEEKVICHRMEAQGREKGIAFFLHLAELRCLRQEAHPTILDRIRAFFLRFRD